MDAKRVGQGRNIEDPPRVYRCADPACTRSISSKENKDRASDKEVCQICIESTPVTSHFLRVKGALDFLQMASCEYYGSYGYTIYGS